MDEIRTRFENRLAELRQAEAMAWAELHAIQGRVQEMQMWVTTLAEEPAMTVGELTRLIDAAGQEDA